LKEERANTVSKSNTPTKAVKAEPASAPASSSSAATGPVTEDEIRAVLMEKKQVTTQDLVSRFKARLKTKEVIFSLIFLLEVTIWFLSELILDKSIVCVI